ncbi:MAG: hypothetical protein F2732_02950 [Actinobacteria bacterium]|nr:hypothetical protein [Actinomycetota bacterium]
MTQTLTGAAMTDNYEEPKKSLEDHMNSDIDSRWNEPATRGDLRNALIRIEGKFDSLRTGIDTRFLGLEQRFGKAERLHQIEFVMIVLGFLGIILNLR